MAIDQVYPPPSNSQKWRFSSGFPTKNGIILVVTVSGWGVVPSNRTFPMLNRTYILTLADVPTCHVNFRGSTLPETNSQPLKIGRLTPPKGNESSSNHHFSGDDMLVSGSRGFRHKKPVVCSEVPQKPRNKGSTNSSMRSSSSSGEKIHLQVVAQGGFSEPSTVWATFLKLEKNHLFYH